MKSFLIAFVLISFTRFADVQKEDKHVSLAGVLSERVFPGLPNYESVKHGDRPEKVWLLTVTKPAGKEEHQLHLADDSKRTFATLRKLNGKKVTVEGLMWEAHTGHHHTPFLITIHSIRQVKD